MAYFVLKSVVRLVGGMHGIFCGEECVVAVRKNICRILW